MSHFSVLVVTDSKPTDDDLTNALAPFHEFECTGTVDQYVQSIDELQEAREKYAERTEARFKSPAGELFEPYEDRFYRDPTDEETKKHGPFMGSGFGGGLSWSSKDWGDGRGYRGKIHFIPEGWEEVRLNTKDVKTFAEFIQDYYGREPVFGNAKPDLEKKHKYGWFRVNAAGEVTECIDRTNPNKKWDWWQLGGRHSGALTPKVGAAGAEKGKPGLMGCVANAAGVDQIRKGDVDFEAMRAAARCEATARWNKVRSIVGDLRDFVTWAELRDVRHPKDIEAARTAYHEQAAVKLIREASKKDHDLVWIELGEFTCSLDEYVQRAADRATVFFACLKDGVWSERGKMGWWACVSNEKADWDRQFNAALDALPDDCWLSVVDCHI